jgi:hypothetical protein
VAAAGAAPGTVVATRAAPAAPSTGSAVPSSGAAAPVGGPAVPSSGRAALAGGAGRRAVTAAAGATTVVPVDVARPADRNPPGRGSFVPVRVPCGA